jgi:hypothetical protein
MVSRKEGCYPGRKMYIPSSRRQHAFRADCKEELSDKMFEGNNLRVMERK